MLTIPTNFNNDIQGKDTNLFPFVAIGNYPDDYTNYAPLIAISTNVATIGGDYFKPLLLNVPGIKESIDVEKRNYKISNVTLNISNAPYEGVRFSELVQDKSLLNMEVRIFWASPSISGYSLYDYDPSWITDGSAFLAYFGTIRRYTHDDEKVTLQLEDRSQSKLHKDLPLANLGVGDEVPDRYKNKHIPMVYGYVDKSPCVLRTKSSGVDIAKILEVIVDDKPILKFIDDNHWHGIYKKTTDSLWVFRNDAYFNAKRVYQGDYSSNYEYDNYTEDMFNATILLEPKYLENGEAGNAIGDNILEVDIIRIPNAFNIPEDYSPYILENPENIIKHTQLSADFSEDSIADFYTNALYLLPSWEGVSDDDVLLVRHFSLHNILEETVSSAFPAGYVHFKILFDYDFVQFGEVSFSVPDDQEQMVAGVTCASNNMHNINYYGFSIEENFATTAYEFQDSYDAGRESGYWLKTSLTPASYLKYKYQAGGLYDVNVSLNIRGIGLYQRISFEKVDKGGFYVDVEGRDIQYYDGTSYQSTNYPRSAVMQIMDILRVELGSKEYTNELHGEAHEFLHKGDINQAGFGYWTDFTVNKKINSKKLIEGLASATPLIPRFDNMGNFKLDIIEPIFEDENTGEEIKAADVIGYSFSKTKIEDVHTRIEFKYNWDYAREEFSKTANLLINESWVIANLGIAGYDYSFYGLAEGTAESNLVDSTSIPAIEDDEVNADSTLIVDDDRGKYIRDGNTAERFAKWLLYWHCNQHLKMKVKLPLKYMSLEIGDYVYFDELINDVKAYGVDYSKTYLPVIEADGTISSYINQYVNGQQIFRQFLVTSTNKTLEFVEIECIQMHNLTDNLIPYNYADLNFICTSPDAINYETLGEDSAPDQSLCIIPTYGCGNIDAINYDDDYDPDPGVDQIEDMLVFETLAMAQAHYISEGLTQEEAANLVWHINDTSMENSTCLYPDDPPDSADIPPSLQASLQYDPTDDNWSSYSGQMFAVILPSADVDDVQNNISIDIISSTIIRIYISNASYVFNGVIGTPENGLLQLTTTVQAQNNTTGAADDIASFLDISADNKEVYIDLANLAGNYLIDDALGIYFSLYIQIVSSTDDFPDDSAIANTIATINVPEGFFEACQNALGDVNLDGAINVLDIVNVVNHILSPNDDYLEDCALEAADFNEDGAVNVLDIVNIVNEILG